MAADDPDIPADEALPTPGADAPAGGLSEDTKAVLAAVVAADLEGDETEDDAPADDSPEAAEAASMAAEAEAHAAATSGLIAPSDAAQPFRAGGEREDTSQTIEHAEDEAPLSNPQAIDGSVPGGIAEEAPLSDPRAISGTGPDGVAAEAPLSDPQAIEAQEAVPMPVALGGVRKVRNVDFRRPTKFTRDQMRRLEGAHDGFCRAASTRLSAELRTGVEIDVTTSDQLSYAAVMSEIPEDAIVTILDVDPIDTQVALIFELPLAVNLIDRLLGAIIARTETRPA